MGILCTHFVHVLVYIIVTLKRSLVLYHIACVWPWNLDLDHEVIIGFPASHLKVRVPPGIKCVEGHIKPAVTVGCLGLC